MPDNIFFCCCYHTLREKRFTPLFSLIKYLKLTRLISNILGGFFIPWSFNLYKEASSMIIIFKPFSFVSTFLLLIPVYAFAWNNGGSFSYSSLAATAVISSSSGTSVTPSYQGISTSSDSYSYYTSQGITIPDTFMSIISKFDISQSVVPSEATIQQGLKETLDFCNKNPLEGNEYKAAIIQPIMNLILSGNYSENTRDLALSNLYSIANNERIDYSQKSTMAEQLIQYMEKEITNTINGKTTAESANKGIDTVGEILVALIHSNGITVEEQKNILTLVDDNKTIYIDSPVDANIIIGILTNICVALVEDRNYPLSLRDIDNIDIGKIELAHLLETSLDTNDNSYANIKVINALNGLLDDQNVVSQEVETILDKTSYVLQNRAKDNYSLKTTCLSTLTKLSTDKRLTEDSRNEAKELITTYGLNAYNRTLYQNNGVLLLAENDGLYKSKAVNILTSIIEVSPDKSPKTVSLQTQLPAMKNSENINGDSEVVGQYLFDNDIMRLKIQDNYKDSTVRSTAIHEITHYIQDNLLTAEQKTELNSIWLEANDHTDFVRVYGETSMSDYLATTAEAVLSEHNSENKPILEQAQQQAANNDPTLLKMYNLAEEIWGLS